METLPTVVLLWTDGVKGIEKLSLAKPLPALDIKM